MSFRSSLQSHPEWVSLYIIKSLKIYINFLNLNSVFRQECSVKKEEVKKYTPVTGCTKEPTELCAPAGCGFKEVNFEQNIFYRDCRRYFK